MEKPLNNNPKEESGNASKGRSWIKIDELKGKESLIRVNFLYLIIWEEGISL